MQKDTQENKIEQIIRKASEGGYRIPTHGLLFDITESRLKNLQEKWRNSGKRKQSHLEDLSLAAGYGSGFRDCSIILDPLFWQALGRVAGWPYSIWREEENTYVAYEWKDIALNFYEIILTEGFDKGIEFIHNLISK